MHVRDARRLTGKNLWIAGAGAALEVVLDDDDDGEALIAAVRRQVAALFARVGLGGEGLVIRRHAAGFSVAVPLGIDALYAGVSALERALELAIAGLTATAEPNDGGGDGDVVPSLLDEIARERNPALLELLSAARERQVPALWDDDEVSLGLGERSRTFAVRELPAIDDVPWSDLGAIPVALVTGTNGKTTTTRFVARMIGAAGLVAGHTSTDGLVVGADVVDGGDWSGPGGARMLLRHRAVQAAVLETARGGMLRRGLALDRADVALVTNVGDDHLGEYGVHDLAAMTDVKLLVARALDDGGTLVLNADDVPLAARGMAADVRGSARVVLFSAKPPAGVTAAHVEAGGVAWCAMEGCLARVDNGEQRTLLRIDEVPLSYGGAAAHNVENALAAAAVGDALGLPFHALAGGLRALRPTPKDSPGRSNVLVKGGVRLLLDFAHNAAGVAVTMAFLAALRAKDDAPGRLIVIVGQAGDRSDEEVRGFARGVHAGGADVVIARDLKGYLRGRAPGKTPALFQDELLRLGLPSSAVRIAGDDVEALTLALELAAPGDTVALLVQVDGEGVHALLRRRGWALDEALA